MCTAGADAQCQLQLLLLAKAVTVALLADEIVLPGEQAGQCGLLAIYLAVCSSIMGLAIQYYAAEALVSGRHADAVPDSASRQWLL